uniref:Vacuolar protein sorting-associated protein 18 homolog n=2 Tax=Eptatretus burgeri TaxID=7764 RepID=A0A8C4Q9Y5_EPTBU
MERNMLLRIDLDNTERMDEIEITRNQDERIHKLFLDPTGSHLLITLVSLETLYVSRCSRKIRPLPKWRSHLVDSVAWNKFAGTEASTGSVLVGTHRGMIFEAELNSTEQGLFGGSPDVTFRRVYELEEDGEPAPVCCLEMERIFEGRYLVMATTRKRLYQFVATGSEGDTTALQGLFSRYLNEPPSFLEFPAHFGYSDLALYTPKLRSSPRAFAWMTGSGVYYGSLDCGRQGSLLTDTQQWTYPTDLSADHKHPLSITLTQFHFLLLFPDHLSAVCTLNGQRIFQDSYPSKFGHLLKMVKDPIKGTVWTYTDNAVFRYYISQESRDVWQMYLSLGRFDLAKEYCKDRPECLDKVQTKQAEHYFDVGKYAESAMYYALTHAPFEEVALKFVKAKQDDALKIFLCKKLGNLKSEEKTQIAMLVAWIVELYLNRLGELRDAGESKISLFKATREEFHKFLAQNRVKECLLAMRTRAMIYNLIASHGDVQDLLFFATLIQDYERVVAHHLQQEDYLGALEVMAKHGNDKLFYKFSPSLVQHIPREVVRAWIEMARNGKLEPKRLVPALVGVSHGVLAGDLAHHALRFLEFCVEELHVPDGAVHDALLALYAQHEPTQVLPYLERQGSTIEQVHYDPGAALRLCVENGLSRAAVHLYSILGQYEEAVDLALQVDVELAKHNADRPEEDDELRRKLWLKIASHAVETGQDVQQAMACLPNCHLLKIEDVLPFFPDFVTIDHFKEAICSSLQDYNQHIEELKVEMEEATESALRIRDDIKEVRNRHGAVGAQDRCTSCGFPLLSRGFFLFLCGHRFHADCLAREVFPHLSSAKKTALDELQQRLGDSGTPAPGKTRRHIHRGEDEGSTAADKEQLSREQLKQEIDDIIAAECIYCGDIMIKSIDKPWGRG